MITKMNKLESDSIIKRIENLERKNKYLRIINLLMLFAILSFVLIAFKSQHENPRIIEAEKFVLKDPELGVLGYFGYDKIDDKQSESLIANVLLTINNGTIKINRDARTMTLDANEMTFYDKSNPSFKPLIISSGSKPEIQLNSIGNSGETNIVSITPNKLALYEKPTNRNTFGFGGNIPKITIANEKPINSAITIFDEQGRIRAVLGSTATKDKQGKTIITPESGIILFDSTGKVTFKNNK